MEDTPVVVPDGFEPITAWRCWYIHVHGGYFTSTAALRSITREKCIWPVGEGLQSRCKSWWTWFDPTPQGCNDGPGPTCQCGIYTKADLNGILSYARGQATYGDFILAYGPVNIWGKIQQHADGYRSEFCYPRGIIVVEKPHWDDDHRNWLRSQLEEYGVPVTFIDKLPPRNDPTWREQLTATTVTNYHGWTQASSHFTATSKSIHDTYERQRKRIEAYEKRLKGLT